jgi:hypothetical protein
MREGGTGATRGQGGEEGSEGHKEVVTARKKAKAHAALAAAKAERLEVVAAERSGEQRGKPANKATKAAIRSNREQQREELIAAKRAALLFGRRAVGSTWLHNQ